MNERVESCVQEDNSLLDMGWYLSWDVDENTACLVGDFTVEELRAIADHMDKYEIKSHDKEKSSV